MDMDTKLLIFTIISLLLSDLFIKFLLHYHQQLMMINTFVCLIMNKYKMNALHSEKSRKIDR